MTKHTGLYDILGISTNATDKEIKTAYRKKAQKVHPDKENGNIKEFQELQRAYEVLSNKDRRKLYDNEGIETEKQSLRDRAIQEFPSLFMALLQQCNVEHDNLILAMEEILKSKLEEIRSANIQIGKTIDRNKEIVRRMKSKNGDNIFVAMAKANTENEKKRAVGLKETTILIKEMLSILKEYEYKIDEMPTTYFVPGTSTFTFT